MRGHRGRGVPAPVFLRVWRKGAKPPRRRERRPAGSGDCSGSSRWSASLTAGGPSQQPPGSSVQPGTPMSPNSSFGSARRTARKQPGANSPPNASIVRPGLLGSSGNARSIAVRRRATKTHAQPDEGQPSGRDQNDEHVISESRCHGSAIQRLRQVRASLASRIPSNEWLHGPKHGGQRLTANSSRFPVAIAGTACWPRMCDRCPRDHSACVQRVQMSSRA